MERRDSGFLSFILGVLTGLVIGLLYAPRPGKETREIIKKSVNEYMEEGKKIYEEKAEELTEVIETGKKTASEKIEELKTKIDETKKTVSDKLTSFKKKEGTEIEALPEE